MAESGQPGLDQRRSMCSTCAAPCASSWRSGITGNWYEVSCAHSVTLPRAGRAQQQRVRCGDHGQSAHVQRGQHGGGPGDEPAEPVADDRRAGLAERADHAGDVGGQRGRVVALRRLVAPAVPAQVHRDGSIAGLGQHGDLVAPGPPELREAVEQQDERPRASLDDVEPRAVRRDVTVAPRSLGVDRG